MLFLNACEGGYRICRSAKEKTITEGGSDAVGETDYPNKLVDGASFALHVVHEEILAEVVGRGEIGFALAHFGNFLDKVDEAVIGGEHEGVDEDSSALAFVDFLKSFADDERIEAEGVFVDTAVVESEGGRFAIGDHDDLAHVLALAEQDALRHAKAFAGIGVVGTDLNAGELTERDFFGGIVEENEVESVAGILRAN